MDVLKSFEELKETWKGDTPMHACHDKRNCGGTAHRCHDRGCHLKEENIEGERKGDTPVWPHEHHSQDTFQPDRADRAEATNGQLTSVEELILDANAMTWNGFCKQEVTYGNDKRDMRYHIDAINNIVLARAAARANPDTVRKA